MNIMKMVHKQINNVSNYVKIDDNVLQIISYLEKGGEKKWFKIPKEFGGGRRNIIEEVKHALNLI